MELSVFPHLKEKDKIMKTLLLLLIVTFASADITLPGTIKVNGTVYHFSHNRPIPGVKISVKGSTTETYTDNQGNYQLSLPNGDAILVATAAGFITKEIPAAHRLRIDFYLKPVKSLEVTELEEQISRALEDQQPVSENKRYGYATKTLRAQPHTGGHQQIVDHSYNYNTEEYAFVEENIFHDPTRKPLSTFSIDVDAASYSNVRRFLQQGQKPPKDAVRLEEMINYFDYDYPAPDGEHPFSVYTELSQAPWNSDHQLLHIGLQGRVIPTDNLPPSNLVFLIDVSGSMNSANKLGLLKSAFRLLTNQLRTNDKVSIVVYAGAAGLVLNPTAGDQRHTIHQALEQLQAGGSTAGGEGIRLAYRVASENFIEGGNNRVILATDGDFNVGMSSNAEMERLISKEKERGVFLTVLGFGMGNYKDSKMEILADKGNGNYAYIDNIMEAKKVLVNEFGGTLFTIAKDVKLQLEFNPAQVKAYRLIGYENRKLRDEDFNDDKKDAGELGSGHTVTALYEIIPHQVPTSGYVKDIDELKYQQNRIIPKPNYQEELMTLKLRYKSPTGHKSRMIAKAIDSRPEQLSESSDNFRWSAAVACFGMLLRDSEFSGTASYDQVEQWAKQAKGRDTQGYRAEFIKMVRSVDLLARQ
jgi:Ca-activated chloride channel family protein